MMSKETIQPGKYVSLTYTISDVEDNLLEQNDIPVSYIHGGEQELIGSMDRAVLGKSPGDMVEMTVAPEDGFGSHNPNLIFTDDIKNVPPEFRRLGAEVQMQNEAGDVLNFYVTKIEDGKLTMDGNHPLAGKTLMVRVTIKEVRDPGPADINPASASNSIN
jgi:FKBP-type peptidyl-prolyl cis-trans isomerase SlyD